MEGRRVTFYRKVLAALTEAQVTFLVGGAFAYCRYARIDRRTKDFDLMVEKETWPELARVLRAKGIITKRIFPHWLGKALSSSGHVDIIYNGGAGLTPVDAECVAHGVPATVLGYKVLLCPPEELLWSKAFIMERERFDGADVLHLIRSQADRFDWQRLCRRFHQHEAVLRAHLILFAYAYPSEAHRVPAWVDPLLEQRAAAQATDEKICRGTYLSRAQYLPDVGDGGFADARLPPFGSMSERHWLVWTNAIDAKRAGIHGVRWNAAPRPQPNDNSGQAAIEREGNATGTPPTPGAARRGATAR